MYGHIELVKDLAERCQARWPEAMFLEPVRVSNVERDAVWRAMRVRTRCIPGFCCSFVGSLCPAEQCRIPGSSGGR